VHPNTLLHVITLQHGRLSWHAARLGLLAAMAVTSINVWTGAPLLGLWVGSLVQGSGPPSMGAFAVAALTILVAVLLLVRLLSVLGGAYDALVGRRTRRHQTAWLKAMSAERRHANSTVGETSALDKVLVGCVVLAVLAFEVWFFFFAGSSLGPA
jgi:hypothetical protein